MVKQLPRMTKPSVKSFMERNNGTVSSRLRYGILISLLLVIAESAALTKFALPWNKLWWAPLVLLPIASGVFVFLCRPPLRLIGLAGLSFMVLATALFASAFWDRHELNQRLPLPVFTVDAVYPTARNTQSKLWYFNERWWAMQSDGGGNSVWSRKDGQWHREEYLDDSALSTLPGRADVWSDLGLVVAVIAGSDRLSVVRLEFDVVTKRYEILDQPLIWKLEDSDTLEERMESATITRDDEGLFWIAYDLDNRIYVRRSHDSSASSWHEAMDISGEIHHDDIAINFPVDGGVAVVWGHQGEEAIFIREHKSQRPFGRWEATQVLAQGNRTADDQFNAAVAPNGRIFLTSKTSLDTVGKPLLSLRLKVGARWQSLPYRMKTSTEMPNRPIALLAGHPLCLYLIHGVFPQKVSGGRAYDKSDYIAYYAVDPSTFDIGIEDSVLIPPRGGINIRAPTSTKQIVRPETAVVALASDKHGNLYEGVLPNNCNPFES